MAWVESMRIDEAIAFAFEAGLDVRGKEAREASLISLGLHASRTADPGGFLERDPQLAARAAGELARQKREDLAIQVLLWECDAAGFRPGKGAPRPLRAYAQAREWGEGGGGTENLAWIRDVPPDFVQREVLAQRLLLRAAADPAHREGLSAACMEAELAELPKVRAFPTIFRACANSGSTKVALRALEGLQTLDPADENAEGRRLLGQLRAALQLLREDLEDRALHDSAGAFARMLSPESAATLAGLAAHMAAALDRERGRTTALELLAKAEDSLDRAPSRPRDAYAALAYVRGALSQGATPGESGVPVPDQLQLPAALRPTAGELAYGALEAGRALRRPDPIMHALAVFDAENVGGVLPEGRIISIAAELVRGAAHLGGRGSRLEDLESLAERVRRLRLSFAVDIYLRALVCDAAARFSALHSSGEAWQLALRISSRRLGRFDQAKMRGRMACEFIAAAQTVPERSGWLDPAFAPTPVKKAPSADLFADH